MDFFKPNTTDLERIKAVKKHRHGRRVKQLEKIEQKMKEERQKRIRERQREFFADIEAHRFDTNPYCIRHSRVPFVIITAWCFCREKLEDSFKVKRERLKGFNRYVKEFHKRKERIHREKLDRIQREKINLLKNNDVEGYLRMVKVRLACMFWFITSSFLVFLFVWFESLLINVSAIVGCKIWPS